MKMRVDATAPVSDYNRNLIATLTWQFTLRYIRIQPLRGNARARNSGGEINRRQILREHCNTLRRNKNSLDIISAEKIVASGMAKHRQSQKSTVKWRNHQRVVAAISAASATLIDRRPQNLPLNIIDAQFSALSGNSLVISPSSPGVLHEIKRRRMLMLTLIMIK